MRFDAPCPDAAKLLTRSTPTRLIKVSLGAALSTTEARKRKRASSPRNEILPSE